MGTLGFDSCIIHEASLAQVFFREVLEYISILYSKILLHDDTLCCLITDLGGLHDIYSGISYSYYIKISFDQTLKALGHVTRRTTLLYLP